jgi:hypothetical protein
MAVNYLIVAVAAGIAATFVVTISVWIRHEEKNIGK